MITDLFKKFYFTILKITQPLTKKYFIILGRHRGPDSPGLLVTDESGKESAPGFAPPHPDTDGGKEEIAPWRRPGSVRSRPISGLTGSGTGSVASLNASSKLSVSSDDTMVRRAHSFGSDDK